MTIDAYPKVDEIIGNAFRVPGFSLSMCSIKNIGLLW